MDQAYEEMALPSHLGRLGEAEFLPKFGNPNRLNLSPD